MSTGDLLIIGGYFFIIFAVAVYLFWQEKRQKAHEYESSDYFLGGRSLGWMVIGASLFASNIGSEHLVGLAGSGASGDFAAGQFEILASLIIILLGWFFVPIYLRSGVFTMPEFLERRYSKWARKYLSWVSIVAYIITKISVTIAAGGIIFTALLGIDFWTGAIIIVLLTGLYTVIGGLKVVIYTDFVQLVVLLGGAIAATLYGLDELGGWEVMVAKTEPQYLSLWRSVSNPNFPWTGILLGAPILGVWYWCTDQFIVQRVLAAKNLDNARKGTIFAGYLKLLPLFIFVLPGVVAFALSTGDNPSLVFPMENGQPQYDAALPALTMQILPHGLKGLVVAGLLAALMSSLSSVFNSCSTLITIDIYKERKPDASEKELVNVGRIATVVLVALGLAWIPLLRVIEGGLFQKLQSIQAYISPPIAAVFIFGMFNKKLNAKGAKWAMLSGAAIGAARLSLEIIKEKGFSLPAPILYFTEINFLHFAFILFIVCSIILYAASGTAPVPDFDKIKNIMYQKGKVEPLLPLHRVLVAGLILCVMSIWWYFS
ncbi:sodium/solute symporter [bacterium]|nr:sodium/solute symporter [bacterium]